MSGVETRTLPRDSLFLLADVRLDGSDKLQRVRVRNLSAGGMMAEGDMAVLRGAQLTVILRNVGEVGGTVAWVQDNRFGIAFARQIDPLLPRAPATGGTPDLATPRFLRTAALLPGASSTGKIRKI